MEHQNHIIIVIWTSKFCVEISVTGNLFVDENSSFTLKTTIMFFLITIHTLEIVKVL